MPRGRGLWEATKHVGAVLALESLIPAISIAGVWYLIDRVRPDFTPHVDTFRQMEENAGFVLYHTWICLRVFCIGDLGDYCGLLG